MNVGDARAIVHKELEDRGISVTDRTVRTHFVAPSAKEAQPGEQNDSATKSVMEKYPDGRRANKGASAEAASNQRRKTCE